MTSAKEEGLIRIVLIHGTPTLWSEADVALARRHRVRGTLAGPVPRFSRGKARAGLPLRLMRVEAKLLLEEGLACAVEMTPSDVARAGTWAGREDLAEAVTEAGAEAGAEKRRAEVARVAPRILEGKRRKGEAWTLEGVIEDEMRKWAAKEARAAFVGVSMAHTFLSLPEAEFAFPALPGEALRHAVYAALWRRGLHVTSGAKFGGDFLAYDGCPETFHASFIVKCLPGAAQLDPCDLVTWVRLGTATKKTFVLASRDAIGAVHFHSFRWTGDNPAEEDFGAEDPAQKDPAMGGGAQEEDLSPQENFLLRED